MMGLGFFRERERERDRKGVIMIGMPVFYGSRVNL
jgi:hypothetical protein